MFSITKTVLSKISSIEAGDLQAQAEVLVMKLDGAVSLEDQTSTCSQTRMSRNRRFPTMWYVQPGKAQTSLHIRAV